MEACGSIPGRRKCSRSHLRSLAPSRCARALLGTCWVDSGSFPGLREQALYACPPEAWVKCRPGALIRGRRRGGTQRQRRPFSAPWSAHPGNGGYISCSRGGRQNCLQLNKMHNPAAGCRWPLAPAEVRPRRGHLRGRRARATTSDRVDRHPKGVPRRPKWAPELSPRGAEGPAASRGANRIISCGS